MDVVKFNIVLNRKKGINLEKDGEQYTLNRGNFWRCRFYKQKCPATIMITGKAEDHYTGIVMQSNHDHPGNEKNDVDQVVETLPNEEYLPPKVNEVVVDGLEEEIKQSEEPIEEDIQNNPKILTRSQVKLYLQEDSEMVIGQLVRFVYYGVLINGEKQKKHKIVRMIGLSDEPDTELQIEWENEAIDIRLLSLSDSMPTKEELEEWINEQSDEQSSYCKMDLSKNDSHQMSLSFEELSAIPNNSAEERFLTTSPDLSASNKIWSNEKKVTSNFSRIHSLLPVVEVENEGLSETADLVKLKKHHEVAKKKVIKPFKKVKKLHSNHEEKPRNIPLWYPIKVYYPGSKDKDNKALKAIKRKSLPSDELGNEKQLKRKRVRLGTQNAANHES